MLTALGRPRIAKKRLFSANGKSFCPSCGEQTLTIRFAKTFSDRSPCTFHPLAAENRRLSAAPVQIGRTHPVRSHSHPQKNPEIPIPQKEPRVRPARNPEKIPSLQKRHRHPCGRPQKILTHDHQKKPRIQPAKKPPFKRNPKLPRQGQKDSVGLPQVFRKQKNGRTFALPFFLKNLIRPDYSAFFDFFSAFFSALASSFLTSSSAAFSAASAAAFSAATRARSLAPLALTSRSTSSMMAIGAASP